MVRSAVSLLITALLAVAATCAVSCSSVQNTRIGIDIPDESAKSWHPVADYMAHRCGTLDCHGQIGRNFRIWSGSGLRLGVDAAADGSRTTPDEYDATFRSLVGLEPAVMSAVVAANGQHPELLTFIRKARGTEAHKGGALVTPGDDQDTCMTSWLAGQTNLMACSNAKTLPQFPMDAGPE